MRVLIACEFSGTIRDAFRRRGHEAWSNDLLGPDDLPDEFRSQEWPNYHYEGDVANFLPLGWDLLIAHPDCTYLCNSGVWALTRTPPNPTPGVLYGQDRWRAMRAAGMFFRELLDTPYAKRVALENPIMHRYAAEVIGRRQDQIVQPYQFGDNASKATGLWLRNLPALQIPHKGQWIAPRIANGRPRWGNQTDGGQNKLTPSPSRGRERAKTYPGIADAMADQWGNA